MKHFLLFFSLLFCARMVPAQGPPLTTEDLDRLQMEQLGPHRQVYAQALAIQDYATAITAIHYILLDDPENQFLKDSLAIFYMRVGNYPACVAYCEQELKKKPNHGFMLELAANVYVQMQAPVAALEKFQRLYALYKVPYFRYQIATLEYQLERYGECATNIESMLLDPAIDEEQVHITWGNGQGDVPMRAALLNLRGSLQLSLGKEGEARKSWREALKIDDDFGLARNNLNALRSQYNDNDRNDR